MKLLELLWTKFNLTAVEGNVHMLIIWVGKEMRLGYGLNPKRVFFLSFLYIHRSAVDVVMYLSMTQHYWNLPISPKGHINHFYNHQTQQKQQLKAQLRHFCIICINTNNQNPVLTSLCLTRQTTHFLNAEIKVLSRSDQSSLNQPQQKITNVFTLDQ